MAERKNFVQVGYGALSVQELATRLGNSFTFFFPIKHRVHSVVGPVQVSYFRTLSKRWSLGAVASYTYIFSVTEEINQTPAGTTQTTRIGEDRPRFYTFMPSVQYNWINADFIKVYSGLSMGLLAAQRDRRPEQNYEDQPRWLTVPFGHLTLYGVRLGKRVGGYVEGGFGTHGLVTGGGFISF
ncbi:hypothetical protein [Rufibacter latericius]|uniref:hypothetical protein n=1 Tax=Rufibacter latericius TaxID=2487040 RepID=UPI000F628AB2|nr:hypothetical protein [Rufibacter latericius]